MKSYGVTIQMKALCLYLHMVILISESVKAHLPDGQGRVQAGHAPTKSLPKTRKLSYQRQVKWQSCLLKGSAGIQVFSSTDIGA